MGEEKTQRSREAIEAIIESLECMKKEYNGDPDSGLYRGGYNDAINAAIETISQALITESKENVTYDNLNNADASNALNPDMPTQELMLHMGELTQSEIFVARAAIRWANSRIIKNYQPKSRIDKCSKIENDWEHENNTSPYTLGGQNNIPDTEKMVDVKSLLRKFDPTREEDVWLTENETYAYNMAVMDLYKQGYIHSKPDPIDGLEYSIAIHKEISANLRTHLEFNYATRLMQAVGTMAEASRKYLEMSECK